MTRAPSSSPARFPWTAGTTLSASPPWPTPSWTASFTTPTGSNSPAGACANAARLHDRRAERRRNAAHHRRRDKVVDNGGLRYVAMESALKPAVAHRHPTRRLEPEPSFGKLENRTALIDLVQANIIASDPREQRSGGRHQIGTLAGFKSECLAGFVGIRNRPKSPASCAQDAPRADEFAPAPRFRPLAPSSGWRVPRKSLTVEMRAPRRS